MSLFGLECIGLYVFGQKFYFYAVINEKVIR